MMLMLFSGTVIVRTLALALGLILLGPNGAGYPLVAISSAPSFITDPKGHEPNACQSFEFAIADNRNNCGLADHAETQAV
jgi:hypothetical protein